MNENICYNIYGYRREERCFCGFLMSVERKINERVMMMKKELKKLEGRKDLKEVESVLMVYCKDKDCVELIMGYKRDLDESGERARLSMRRSSLRVLKRFKNSYQSKRKAKIFYNSVRVHAYFTSQYERDPDLQEAIAVMSELTEDYYVSIAREFGLVT